MSVSKQNTPCHQFAPITSILNIYFLIIAAKKQNLKVCPPPSPCKASDCGSAPLLKHAQHQCPQAAGGALPQAGHSAAPAARCPRWRCGVGIAGSDLWESITNPCFMNDKKRSGSVRNHHPASFLSLFLICSIIHLSFAVAGLCKM